MADKEKVELKPLTSFKELQFEGPELQMDLEEDAWSYGAPPPAGVYLCKWYLAKDGCKFGYEKKDDPSTLFTQVTLEGKVVNDPEWNDASVFAYLDSRIFRGKHISSMAGFLVKTAGAVALGKAGKLTPAKLAKFVEQIVAKEPPVRAELDWKGSYKWVNKNGAEVYENLYRHYTDFPTDPEDKSKRVHVCTVTGKDGGSYEVRAMVQVVRFFAKDEKIETKVLAASKVTTAAPILVVEEDPILSAKVTKTGTQVVSQDDDMLLLQD